MARRAASVVALLWSVIGGPACAEPSHEQASYTPQTIGLESAGPSAAYPNDSFGEQLSAAASGAGGPVGSSGYRPGPGRRDQWKVGPHWRASVDGLLLFRDSADLDGILAEVGPISPSTTLPDLEFRENFDHAAGARLLVTSDFHQCAGYELQVGYTGLEKWMANAYWAQETLAAASLPLSDIDVQQQRSLSYESSLHSLEVNFQRVTRGYLKPYAGVRYFGFDESIDDVNRQFVTGILGDPVNVGDTLSSATTQTRSAVEIENNLIGFQGGLRIDMWRPTRRFEVTGFLSGGVYCNIIDRNRISQSSTVVTTNERVTDGTTESTETTTTTAGATNRVSGDGVRVAFSGEAALAGVWRLNRSTSLRGGYQVLFLEGVDVAENLWVSPPSITAISDDLFLHGWFAGLEYRR